MRKFFLRWLVMFIVANVLSFIVHGLLLKADYTSMAQLMRTEQDAQQYMLYMFLAHICMSGAMVWIYSRGIESRPWMGQGLRFGLALWVLISVPIFLIYFAVQPMPGMIVAKQIAYELPMMLLIGLTLGALHKGESAAVSKSQAAAK